MALNLATSFRGEPRGSFGRGHQASAVDVEDQALLHHEECLIARLRSWLCWPSQLLARAVLLTVGASRGARSGGRLPQHPDEHRQERPPCPPRSRSDHVQSRGGSGRFERAASRRE